MFHINIDNLFLILFESKIHQPRLHTKKRAMLARLPQQCVVAT